MGLTHQKYAKFQSQVKKSKSWEVKKTSLAVELVLDRVSVIESD